EHGRLGAHKAEHNAFGLGHETQWCKITGAGRIVFEEEVIDFGLGEETLCHGLITTRAEVVALEVAAAHVNANCHAGGTTFDCIVDAFDIKVDKSVKVASGVFDLPSNAWIAQQSHSHLVELNVAAARFGKLLDLLLKNLRQIREECIDIRVNRPIGKIVAPVKVHSRRCRQCDLSGDLRYSGQEHEFIECERLQSFNASPGVRCGELDLMPAVVPKPERSGSDLKPFRALDETSPIGTAAEFPVGHNFKADLLLKANYIADALIL